MSDYNVYLDNNLQSDTPSSITDFEISIIRESDFNSESNILREATQTELMLWGDGYKYLRNKKKANRCALVDTKIDYDCGNGFKTLYNGKIKIPGVEFNLTECTAKTKIKDSSFTGLIKDYLKTDANLYYTKSKNCENITTPDKQIYFGVKPHLSFDVLDVFKYIIAFFTDNKIQVQSTYLTTNKLAICTGFALHNTIGGLDKLYPKITFNSLFVEIRKKHRIYMGIELTAGGVPYLRIENEDYFYDNTQIFSIDEIPTGTIETFDLQRLFNSIEVGSTVTTLADPTTGFVGGYTPNTYQPNTPKLTWDKQTYNNCSECTVDADSQQNKLDLVSTYVIDTDLFVEALSAVPTTIDNQYAHDSDIFLFEYDIEAGVLTAKQTLYVPTGQHIYNAGLRNENVINRWLGYSPQCISEQRNSLYGFKGFDPSAGITYPIGSNCYFRRAQFLASEVIYDTDGIFTDETYSLADPCYNQSAGPYTVTAWHCPITGQYAFKGVIGNIVQIDGSIGYHMDYKLSVVWYTDGTFATEVGRVDTLVQVSNSKTQPATVIVDTGLLGISAGNIVVLEYDIKITSGEEESFIEEVHFDITNISFELTQDGFSCVNLTEPQINSRPNIIDFEYKLCFSELQAIRANKRGYMMVGGQKFWIKQIVWKERALTKFTLIGSNIIYNC